LQTISEHSHILVIDLSCATEGEFPVLLQSYLSMVRIFVKYRKTFVVLDENVLEIVGRYLPVGARGIARSELDSLITVEPLGSFIAVLGISDAHETMPYDLHVDERWSGGAVPDDFATLGRLPAKSGRSRPLIRDDVAHPFRFDVAHGSEMISPRIPG
jgi:hypothetical protein